jgi:hypothetical protein
MSITDQIIQKRREYIAANREEPAILLIHPETYYYWLGTLPDDTRFHMTNNEEAKFMGMIVIDTYKIDIGEIKVGNML